MRKRTANFYVLRNDVTFLYSFEYLSIRSETFGAGIQAFEDPLEAYKMIEEVIRQVQKPECFETHQDAKGRHFFTLKSDNGEVIFRSRKCPTRIGLNQLISQVEDQTPEAEYDKPEGLIPTEQEPSRKNKSRYY